MDIAIVPVDRANWMQCVSLEVKPHQLGSVGTNVLSLAEVSVRPEAQARAVLCNGNPVGMAVYLKNSEDGRYHIHRFMIDKSHQRQGIGRASLRLLVDEIRSLPDYTSPVIIEFIENNIEAQQVYEVVGFKNTGRTVKNCEWGFVEKVYAFED
jgi:diamine N-acetyltransferase